MKIQLKINGEWAVLPPDFYLKMMKTSPLFSDQGDFSYPFELPVEPNRHIFGPIADPMGFVRLREFHALPAEIWFEGNQVFVGQTEISGEQTFSQRGKVSFNVVSNNGAFKDMISGLNCRDVKLKDQILLGWRPSRIEWEIKAKLEGMFLKEGVSLSEASSDIYEDASVKESKYFRKGTEIDFSEMASISLPVVLHNTSEYNVDRPYPAMPYCNVRVCCKNTADKNVESTNDNEGYGYKVYEADGDNSAPSFFLMYFLDCLFGKKSLDIDYDNSNVAKLDDMNRLAFLNVYPRFDDDMQNEMQMEPEGLRTYVSDLTLTHDKESIAVKSFYYNLFASLTVTIDYTNYNVFWNDGETDSSYSPGYSYIKATEKHQVIDMSINDWREKAKVYKYNCYANGDNFPDVSVENVISDLKNAFGVVFDYNQECNFMRLHLVRDIFLDRDVLSPDCIITKEPTITRTSTNGQILSYGGEGTNFNYRMPTGVDKDGNPDPIICSDFIELSSMKRSKNDSHTYYDKNTGNAFRVKVNEETGKEPQFFAVDTYRDYKIGIYKEMSYRDHKYFDQGNEFDPSDTQVKADRDESNAETIKINFEPVVVNDIWSWDVNKGRDLAKEAFDYPESAKDQDLCVFVDAEGFNDHEKVGQYLEASKDDYLKLMRWGFLPPNELSNTIVSKTPWIEQSAEPVLSSEAEMLSFSRVDRYDDIPVRVTMKGKVRISGDNAFDITSNEHPLAKANVKYVLGFMRGPGNESGEEYGNNYDDEGNDTWSNVSVKPSFTADSIDYYGGTFDYNGIATDVNKLIDVEEAKTLVKRCFPASNVDIVNTKRLSSADKIYDNTGWGPSRNDVAPLSPQALIAGIFECAGKYYLVSIVDSDGKVISTTSYYAYLERIKGMQNNTHYPVMQLDKMVGKLFVGEYNSEGDALFYATYLLRQLTTIVKDGDGKLVIPQSSIPASFNVNELIGNGGAELDGRLSLLLDARKVKKYDDEGNPVYYDVNSHTLPSDLVARRGLVPQLLEDFLYFKAHHVKVTFPVLMSLSAINNLQLLKWNRFGDYVGLIKQVNYELTESGLRNVKVELLVANK